MRPLAASPAKIGRGFGRRKINDCVRTSDQIEGVVGYLDSVGPEACQFPQVASHIRAARGLGPAGQSAAGIGRYGADEFPAHTAGGTHHGDLHLWHGRPPLSRLAGGIATATPSGKCVKANIRRFLGRL